MIQVLRDDFSEDAEGGLKAGLQDQMNANAAVAQRPVSNWSAKKLKASPPVKSEQLTGGSLLGLHNQLLKLPEIDSLRASVTYSKDEIQKVRVCASWV